jgi:hypothetical protein
MVTQSGVRIVYTWRLNGTCGTRLSTEIKTRVEAGGIRVTNHQQWSDGSRSRSEIFLSYDSAWGAYVAEVKTVLDARRVTRALEYCNILPAAIGDSRPGRERHPFTYWSHPDGLRKMLKNPLWFASVGAQDLTGEKHVAQGGFLGFGPDDIMNPVIEIVRSDPETGATTCDGLQDEHIMAFPADGRHAAPTGWFHLEAHYRLFSIPPAMAERLVKQAKAMTPGAMLAWKFQYPPTPELPADLTRVKLPGSRFYGPSDWSQPVPWDRPYNGQLWTASPDPAAAIYYDRKVGRKKPGSIRLRVDGTPISFNAGSGHTLHLDEGQTYRFSIWIKTRGNAKGYVQAAEALFRAGDRAIQTSKKVGPNSTWTQVQASVTGQKDEVPFAIPFLSAEGKGEVWFTDPCFEPIP